MAILSEPGKILITGATHGIGKAAAELFCSRGWEVYGISGNGEDGRGAAMEKRCPDFITALPMSAMSRKFPLCSAVSGSLMPRLTMPERE